MKISLIDVDSHNFPNLALMKIAAYHKKMGDAVDWYSPLFSNPDRVYASKVFSFTPDIKDYAARDPEPIRGGTGYDIATKMPDEIENMKPDYSIYPQYDFAVGFLSRGCIRQCSFCVVPRKEGTIHPVADIEEVAVKGRKTTVLMDNNFLANERDFVRVQLQKIASMKLRIDFNQGLDCRLVDDENARWLAACKWGSRAGGTGYIRFACDHQSVIGPCKDAISKVRRAGFSGEIFVYVLAKDVNESFDRMQQIMVDKNIIPFIMPFRDISGNGTIKRDVNQLARWANRLWIRKSCTFDEYKKGIGAK